MTSIAITLLLLANPPPPPANPHHWEQLMGDESLRVWTRPVPGFEVREIKAVMEIPAPVERAWEVMQDAAAFPEFMPHLVEAKIVRRDGPDHFFLYQRVEPPVINPRDYTMEIFQEVDSAAGRYVRRYHTANHAGPPPRDGTVRIELARGSWIFTRAGPGKTRLDYRLINDPGGSVPKWMVEAGNKRSIPNLLRAVSRRAQDPTWRP